MESIIQSQALQDFLAHDEELQRLQSEIENQASKYGFNNVAFQEQRLPQLEKKYGPTDSINNFSNEDDYIPEPSQFPSEIKPKVIRYDVKASGAKAKTNNMMSFDEFNKNKGRPTQKSINPPQDFAPLKRISGENAENTN
jgi:hypothetical protein